MKSSIACLAFVDAEHIKKTFMKTMDLAKLIPLLKNYRKKSYGSTGSSISTGAN